MKGTLIAGLVSCLAFAGCSPALIIDKNRIIATERDVICTKETPIGSHMPVTRCTTAAQRAADREAAAAQNETVGGKRPGASR